MHTNPDYVIDLTGRGRQLVESLRREDADDSLRAQASALLSEFEQAISTGPVDQARYELEMQIGTLPLAELATQLEEFLLTASGASQRLADVDGEAAAGFRNLW